MPHSVWCGSVLLLQCSSFSEIQDSAVSCSKHLGWCPAHRRASLVSQGAANAPGTTTLAHGSPLQRMSSTCLVTRPDWCSTPLLAPPCSHRGVAEETAPWVPQLWQPHLQQRQLLGPVLPSLIRTAAVGFQWFPDHVLSGPFSVSTVIFLQL